MPLVSGCLLPMTNTGGVCRNALCVLGTAAALPHSLLLLHGVGDRGRVDRVVDHDAALVVDDLVYHLVGPVA